MLAHIHIFVAQEYKNLYFKVNDTQYSLKFWGQDALQSEEMIVFAKLKAHSFVYNYRRCWTL